MPIDPSIFKAYDIRGLHGEQLGPDHAELIGRAFVRVLSGLAGKPAGDLRIGLGRIESSPRATGRAWRARARMWSTRG